MKRLIALFLCMVLMPAFALGEAAAPWSSPGFSTPEEAVMAFLSGLQDLDLNKAFGAFAWEQCRVGDRFTEILQSSHSYSPEGWPAFPGDAGLLSEIDEALLMGGRVEALSLSFAKMTLHEDAQKGEDRPAHLLRSGYIKTEEEADALLASFDLSLLDRLAGMDHIRVLTPEEATGGSYGEKSLKALERFRILYGAEEVCERAALFTLGGQEYACAPMLGRYGESWYIVSLFSSLSNYFHLYGDEGAFRLTGEASDSGTAPGETPAPVDLALPWRETGGTTPEAAVALYLSGLKKNSLNTMMEAFAWESLAGHATLRSVALGRSYYQGAGNWPVFPDDNPLLEQIDMGMMVKWRLEGLRLGMVNYATNGAVYDLQEGITKRALGVRGDEEARAVAALFDPGRVDRLDTLDDIRFVAPEAVAPEYAASEGIRNTLEKYRVMYGADELANIAALFTIDGEEYLVAPQLVRYGDRWYIVDMQGVLSAVMGISPEDIWLCKG